MAMTSYERFVAVLDRQPVDQTPIAVSPWSRTVERWRGEGHIGAEEDVAEHFGQDIRTGGWLNSVADLDFEPEVLEETEETVLTLDGNGAMLRRHKLHDSTPEHVDFTVKGRAGWEEHVKPHLVDVDRRRIPFEGYRNAKKFAAEKQREDGPLTSQAGKDGKDLSLQVDLEQALADRRYEARRHVLQVAVSDRSVDRHQTTVILSYIAKVPLDPDAIYLSDLKPVKSFAHGGLILDRDYGGKVAEIVGRIYPKCVMICPEPSADGTHGEAIYELPGGQGPLTLKADIGIEEMARGNGSAVFMVHCGDTLDGQWETLFSSSVLYGGGEPVSISVKLGRPKYLRLYTTDAGDGINSDHALWGNARLN